MDVVDDEELKLVIQSLREMADKLESGKKKCLGYSAGFFDKDGEEASDVECIYYAMSSYLISR